MNVLELEQQVYKKQLRLRELKSIDFMIAVPPTFQGEITFMVWDKKTPSGSWLLFSEGLEVIENINYNLDIDAAREALKQYLAQEVE
jgi:hypothetical protein